MIAIATVGDTVIFSPIKEGEKLTKDKQYLVFKIVHQIDHKTEYWIYNDEDKVHIEYGSDRTIVIKLKEQT